MEEVYNRVVIRELLLANKTHNNVDIAKLYNEKLSTKHVIDNLRRVVKRVRRKLELDHPSLKRKKEGVVDQVNNYSFSNTAQITDKYRVEERGDVLTEEQTISDFTVNAGIVTTMEQALALSKVDMSMWEVDHHVWNSWTTSAVDRETGNFKQINNVQVKLWFKRINLVQNNHWSEFVKSLEKYTPDYRSFERIIIEQQSNSKQVKENLLELSLPDLHVGKLGWSDESGEDYNTKEACKRYNKAVDKLLSQVNLKSVEKILLPIGNDMINIDTKQFTTTAGTPQACDSRWQQMFAKAKELLIYNIDRLSYIAPVEVLVVPGNHDNQTMYYLGDTLKSWYRTSTLVSIDNEPKQRKYHQYGVNLIGFTHGNEERHDALPNIMATEKAQMWADTKYREFHLGHYHKSKSTRFVDVDEFPGCKVRIIPSLSGSDAWHNTKGYMSMKGAEAFLYNKENGMIANYKYNILK